jgi:DNA-binding beta-propeller fold protein YncE
MSRASSFFASALLLGGVTVSVVARADGPGLQNVAYAADEVLKPLGHLGSENGSPRGHGTLSLHRGYVAVVFSKDSGEGDGGFAFYDLSDVKNPKLVASKDDDETEDIREGHGYGYTSIDGRDYVVLQASYGIQFWDWTDVTAPVRTAYLKLPGVERTDYETGAWWTFWQGNYVYVGGSGNGIYIVDARDPANPKLVDRGPDKPNPIPISTTGNFRIGPVFAVGNLMAAGGSDLAGYVTFDIRDPENPIVLSARRTGMPTMYASLLNGNLLLGAGTNEESLYVHDISDPTNIVELGSAPLTQRGGYSAFQDGFAFIGASLLFRKIDIRTLPYTVVLEGTNGLDNRDEDFANVFGNLVFISDDHGHGSLIVPHQAEADTKGPAVNMVSPKNGAVGQALTSRIGVTFTDQIDKRTPTKDTFIVRPVGGSALSGRFSYQTNILNFSPDEPLLPDTTYEVLVPEGGILDAVGNAVEQQHVSYFSTGGAIVNPLCKLTGLEARLVGTSATVAVDAMVSNAESYTFDFGDGTKPVTGASIDATHTFAAPGRFTVVATLRSGDDIVTSCAGSIVIHRPLAAGKPESATGMALDDAGARLFVAHRDNDTVSAVRTSDLTVAWETDVAMAPESVAIGPGGEVWAASDRKSEITILDPETGAVKATLPLPRGSRGRAIVLSPDRATAYVALQGTGKLARVDTAARSIVSSLDVGPTPRGLARSADGKRLFVTRLISPADQAEVVVVDATAFTVEKTISFARDKGPDGEASSRGVLNYLRSPALSPDGTSAFFPAVKDNTERGFYLEEEKLTFETTVRSVIAELDLGSLEETVGHRTDLNDRSLPAAVVFSPLGDLAFVAVEGNDKVEVLDAYTRATLTGVDSKGAAPDSLLLSPDGKMLFVRNFLDRNVAAYDVSGILDATTNQASLVGTVVTSAREKLSAEELRGKKIFYGAGDRRMSRDGYLACAVCHLDGEHDGRTWDFTERGEGLRNTTTLLGRRGTGHGNVHWTGNFDEIQDFENDVRKAFAGKGFMTDEDFASDGRDLPLGGKKAGRSADLDALAAYVTSLSLVGPSPFRNEDGSLTDDGKKGRSIFQKSGCETCHGGADFTNSVEGKLFDVGTIDEPAGQRLGETLTGFDAPTLKGLWETGPYLHDGRAGTVADMLSSAGGTHGKLSSLSAEERSQLAAYVVQIDDMDDSVDPGQVPDGGGGGGAPDAGTAQAPVVSPSSDDGGCSIGERGATTAAWPLSIALSALFAGMVRLARQRRRPVGHLGIAVAFFFGKKAT